MSISVVLFLAAVLIPVFFASARTAPLWLFLQAMALAARGLAQHGGGGLQEALIPVLEFAVLRGAVAPSLLYGVTSQGLKDPEGSHTTPAVGHLLPSNLLAWALGVGVVVLGFEFAWAAGPADHAFEIGTICATVVLGLLLLATNDGPYAQIFAVLIIENAAALFESILPDPWSLAVHAALAVIYFLTVWVSVWVLTRKPDDTSTLESPKQVL